MQKVLLIFILILLPEVFSAHMNNASVKKEVIAFVADTQAPMWIEGIWLKKDNNPEATKMVLHDILRLKPATLFMLGDVVTLGPSRRAWLTIDYFMKEFNREKIPVYGILGNHELMQRPVKGEKNFQEFFPDHIRTGYVQIVDSVAVLLMNSNITSLSTAEVKKQFDWYNKTLHDLDGSDAIKSVIVTCHHPPFTNSKMVSPSNFVQQNFVPGFIKSHKAKLFLTGHAHRFEYFRYEDKDFLVIGGGGGLGHPPKRGGVRFPDLAPEYKPSFHYLTVERTADSLIVQSHALKKDFKGFEFGKRLSISIATNDSRSGTH